MDCPESSGGYQESGVMGELFSHLAVGDTEDSEDHHHDAEDKAAEEEEEDRAVEDGERFLLLLSVLAANLLLRCSKVRRSGGS